MTGVVEANVNGYGTAPALSGVNITAYNATCPDSPSLPMDCATENSTVTNSSGGFTLGVAKGDYYLVAQPDPAATAPAYPYGFGTSAQYVRVGAATALTFVVDPEVPYDQASLVLPGYVCDAGYLDNDHGWGPGCQNPVLSWLRTGAYYLNATDELVYDSFANGSLTDIAPWVPLYQTFPDYAMIPNELFLTQDGAWVYGWGTLTSSSKFVWGEAVDVTTQQRVLYNFTGVTTASFAMNGQVQITGWDGNDSELALVLSNGSVVDHPLAGSGQSWVGKFSFFEANNVYWEPYLNGFVDFEADGSSEDGVQEWQLTGPTSARLVLTYDGTWGSGITVNGVNGVAYNVSSRELSVQAEWSGLTYHVGATGTIGPLLQVTNDYPAGTPPAIPLGPIGASDRPQLIGSGPMMNGNYPGFGNESWLLSMTPGHLGSYSTNVSPFSLEGTIHGIPDYAWYQWSQEGFYYNSSYLIAPTSYLCAHLAAGSCTIDGDDGAAPGTIAWMWRAGLPEFPNPASAPLAAVGPPPPLNLSVVSATNSTLSVNWTAVAMAGLVNYTLGWGRSPTPTSFASILPGNTSYTLVGLRPHTRYYASISAWNLHFEGAPSNVVTAFTRGPPAPTALVASDVTDASVMWAWSQSSGAGIQNDTLRFYLGASCAELRAVYTTPGPATSFTISGLDPSTRYSARVAAANASGESGPSSCVGARTLAVPPPPTTDVTFVESHLPANETWFVNITGAGSRVGEGDRAKLTFSLTNGTHNFTEWSPTGGASNGSLEVNGTPIVIRLTFFKVVVREIGLATGTWWNASANDLTIATNSSRLTFDLLNGTYTIVPGAVAQFETPVPQSVSVAGGPAHVNFSYAANATSGLEGPASSGETAGMGGSPAAARYRPDG